jgi:signal transduction histidine kinase
LKQYGRIAFESAHVKKDGSVMPVEINARMTGLNGKQVIFSVIRDITERKQVEQALQEKTRQLEDLTRNLEKKVAEEIAVRMKNERMMMQQSKMAAMGEMLGAIAHQWRQPLNVVGLIVQRIEDAYARGKLDREYLEETVEKAMSQIHHMSKTIDDFRSFYKPDKEKTVFNAMRAVGDVLSLVSAQLAADNIKYRLTCHTHGKTFENAADVVFCSEKAVEGFRNEFEHAILNLINNARDAIIEKNARGGIVASERGLLSFDFYDANGKVIIKVSDNGGGIPPEAMRSIFDPYFTTKETTKGTGLGLYMSKVIVEDHMRGKLSVDNTDGGVIFTIELPIRIDKRITKSQM